MSLLCQKALCHTSTRNPEGIISQHFFFFRCCRRAAFYRPVVHIPFGTVVHDVIHNRFLQLRLQQQFIAQIVICFRTAAFLRIHIRICTVHRIAFFIHHADCFAVKIKLIQKLPVKGIRYTRGIFMIIRNFIFICADFIAVKFLNSANALEHIIKINNFFSVRRNDIIQLRIRIIAELNIVSVGIHNLPKKYTVMVIK